MPPPPNRQSKTDIGNQPTIVKDMPPEEESSTEQRKADVLDAAKLIQQGNTVPFPVRGRATSRAVAVPPGSKMATAVSPIMTRSRSRSGSITTPKNGPSVDSDGFQKVTGKNKKNWKQKNVPQQTKQTPQQQKKKYGVQQVQNRGAKANQTKPKHSPAKSQRNPAGPKKNSPMQNNTV